MNHTDQMRLALEAKVSLSSILAYLRGDSMREPTKEIIRQCAERLKIKLERKEKKPTRRS